MRELKFRIWDKQQNRFHTDRDWGISLDGTHIIGISSHDRWDHDKGYKIKLTDNLVIQQYTGLKDKNGKDVYEGDIIQYNVGSSYENMNFIVQWSEDSLGYILQSQSGDILTNSWTPDGNRFNFIELKGNVFENKELLK